MTVIARNDAEKLYRKGKTVYVSVQSKQDNVTWWDMDEFFEKAKCVPHVQGSFEKLSLYFNKHYCPGCRIRYAIDPNDTRNYFKGRGY